MSKRIGILTSGGDCPGLNAVIRAVVSHATLTYGWQVLGIPYATRGLLERKTMPLSVHHFDLRGIDPLLNMGGTILGTINKGATLEHSSEIIASYNALELDALVGIGGDGSLAILHHLAQQGNWNLIAIPKTIDNDIALTDQSIGFDSAINTITDALTRLTFTAASHDRVMVVEVMGREAGHLALQSGIAGGADVILIPEIPYSIKGICHHIAELSDRWARRYAIVIVAEGISPEETCVTNEAAMQNHQLCDSPKVHCGMGLYIAEQIDGYSNKKIETRVSVLGHIQRGGIPSALDRLMATAFGKAAVDLIAQENYSQMVAWQNGQVVAVPLDVVIAQSPSLVKPDSYLLQTAQAVGTYIGDPSSVSGC